RWLIGEGGALAPRGGGEQGGRAGRADLLVAVDDDLVAELGQSNRLDRAERGEHDRKAALHIGDAGAAEHALLAPEDLLEGMVGAENRVHVAGEEKLRRRVG